jgi:hypothetical protein
MNAADPKQRDRLDRNRLQRTPAAAPAGNPDKSWWEMIF